MNYYRCLLFILLAANWAYGQVRTDSLERQLQKHPAKDEARVDLLNDLGYEYWIIDAGKSVAYGKQALALSEELRYQKGKAKAHRVTGVAWWALGELKPALENLAASRNLYEKLNDDEGVANCLVNSGMVYADIRDHETALKLYDRAIAKFTSLGLKSRIATTYAKIGALMVEKKQYSDAKEYLTNALNIHLADNFTYGIAEAHNKLGKLYLETNEPEQADYHLRKAIVAGKKVNDEDGLISNLILFGKLLRIRGEYEAAEAHLDIAIEKAMAKHLDKYRLEAYHEMMQLKKSEGKDSEALSFYDRYTTLHDSVFAADTARQIAALEFTRELEAKSSEVNYLDNMRKVLTVAVIIISILSFWLIRSLRKKNKSQKGLLQTSSRESEVSLQAERRKQAELAEQLDYKNRELTSYALNFVQKNELLGQLEERIAEIKTMTPQKQAKALTDLEKILRGQKNLDKDWEDFKLHFEQVHPAFFVNLKDKFPHLSANDLKLVAFARLNLSLKETSNILGISHDSVKTARYRLRKKLGLDGEEELFAFLLDMEK